MLEKYAHVFPAMVTPMNEDGSFNYEVAKKHADWMMDNGIGGIGVLMAAGEYQSMSLEEHMEYVILWFRTLNSEEHLLLLDVQERELKMPAR